MKDKNLFGEMVQNEGTSKRAVPAKKRVGPAKLLRAERNQVLLTPTDLEGRLPADHVARVMKMGDGEFRPAWNVQIASDTASRIITGVSVDNRGSDRGELLPFHQEP